MNLNLKRPWTNYDNQKNNHEISSLLHGSFFVYLWIISDLAYITNLVD